MTCPQSEAIDLAEFLRDPDDDSQRAFRAHYPTCPDCSEAVADWLALDQALRDVGAETMGLADGHPEPEALEAFVDGRATTGGTAMQIEEHLAHCPGCAAEVRLLRGFDAAALVEATEPASSEAVRACEDHDHPSPFDLIGWLGVVRETLARPARGWVWAPAAVVAAVALTIWLSLDGDPSLAPGTTPADPSFALDSTGGGPPGDVPPPGDEALAPAADQLARDDGPPEAPPEPVVDPTQREVPPRPDTRTTPPLLADAGEAAKTRSSPSPEPMAPTPTPAEATDAEEEVLLLAALDALPPLDYARPADRTNQAWMRQFGPVRSGGAAALIDARAPADHAGLTLDDSPRLWWSLSDATDAPIEVTVVDEEALDPLLRVSLPGPHAAGLHSIDLGAHGVELEPGVEYRWFATVVLDPDRPSRNPISVGSLEVVERDSSLRDEVGPEDDPTRGHRLASLGLWYDAFDFYATLAERHPSIERLARERDRLSSLAGDAEAAAP